MADTSVVNLNTDFVGLRGCHLDLLNAQVLAGLPGDGGLALDGLFVTELALSRVAASYPSRLIRGVSSQGGGE